MATAVNPIAIQIDSRTGNSGVPRRSTPMTGLAEAEAMG
jgi:hypothetical protein